MGAEPTGVLLFPSGVIFLPQSKESERCQLINKSKKGEFFVKRIKMIPFILLIVILVIQPLYAFAGVKESDEPVPAQNNLEIQNFDGEVVITNTLSKVGEENTELVSGGENNNILVVEGNTVKLNGATMLEAEETNYFVSTSISSMEASFTDKLVQNPYVQQYLKEKDKSRTTSEALVDPELEEKIIISTLTEYYNEDVKVANIIKKHQKNTNLTDKAISLNKEDKINVMHAIKEIYPYVKDQGEQNVLIAYFKRYARNSNDNASLSYLNEFVPQLQSINRVNEKEDLLKQGKESVSTLMATSSYDWDGAGNWAYNNYNKYNTNYPAFNNPNSSYSDCTNFVSQAMHVGGGMPMQGNWYCYKKNSTYPSPINATQLDYSWSLSDPSPWISVSQFEQFWRPKATARFYTHDYYIANHKTIFSNPIYRGDIVILHKGIANWVTIPTHAMIISKYDTTNKDFKLAGHSQVRQEHPLLLAIADYAEVEFISP